MVKNQKKDTKKETNDIEVYNKIIDLCLWNQIQDSHHWIELLSNKIKIYELRRDHLLNNKPFKFQKKKLEKYHKELESIEKTILKSYQDIDAEMTIIEKMLKVIES